MPDLFQVHNKSFAIIMVADDGSEAGDSVFLTGTTKWRDGNLFVHCGMDIPEFPIPDDALDRVKEVSAEVRDILEGADYSITLTVGPIPDDVDPAKLLHTGFRWSY